MWLRYAALDAPLAARVRADLPATVFAIGSDAPILSARDELARGVRGMLQVSLTNAADASRSAIVIGTVGDIRKAIPDLPAVGRPAAEGYWLKTVRVGTRHYVLVAGADARGTLYGTFALLRAIGTGRLLTNLDETDAPFAPVRWVNQWDNLDGTIERGYGGRSIFWENGRARQDLTRVGEYARLLASIGINAVSINNVNADPRLLDTGSAFRRSPGSRMRSARGACASRSRSISAVPRVSASSQPTIRSIRAWRPGGRRSGRPCTPRFRTSRASC